MVPRSSKRKTREVDEYRRVRSGRSIEILFKEGKYGQASLGRSCGTSATTVKNPHKVKRGLAKPMFA